MNITGIIYPIYFVFTSIFMPNDYYDQGLIVMSNLRGSINNSYIDDYYYDDDDDYYYFDDNYRLN